MSWSDVVKGKKVNNPEPEYLDHYPEEIELKRNICPRCNYKWADHPEENGGYRWLRVSCGIDMKSEFPIKYGEKFNWNLNNGSYDIVICRGCRGEFLDNVCKNWWWCGSKEYYEKKFDWQKWNKFAHMAEPLLTIDNIFHNGLQGFVPETKLQIDRTADIFVCRRCHVDTNIICTVKMSADANLNLSLTKVSGQTYQPYEFFKYDKETELYEIKLCLCCRDSLVDCMLNKWWNGEIDDCFHHW